jgi:NAD(P)-dependent dehydrogenase (short-subunit alcohol dehydrogenase family)
VIDRDLLVAEDACREIRKSVVKELEVPEDEVAEVNAWGCDVTDTEQVRETIGLIGKKFRGGIDIFVGAAGDFLLNSLSLRLLDKLVVKCLVSVGRG